MRDPNFLQGLLVYCCSVLWLCQRGEAQNIITQLKQISKRSYVLPHIIAAIYTALGESNQAFAWLQRAYQDRSSPLVWIKVDPWFDNLRADPRFIDLVRRMGVPL